MKATAASRYFKLLLLVFVVAAFVAVGDRYLPAPFSTASYRSRRVVNGVFSKVFPYIDPVDNPHRRTEREIEKLERN